MLLHRMILNEWDGLANDLEQWGVLDGKMIDWTHKAIGFKFDFQRSVGICHVGITKERLQAARREDLAMKSHSSCVEITQ